LDARFGGRSRLSDEEEESHDLRPIRALEKRSTEPSLANNHHCSELNDIGFYSVKPEQNDVMVLMYLIAIKPDCLKMGT